MDFWKLIYRFSWTLLAVLVVIGLTLVFAPKLRSIAQLREKKNMLTAENEALEAQIRATREKQRRFTTEPSYVERTAREIGMVRPGETVYVFTNQAGRPSPVPAQPGGAP